MRNVFMYELKLLFRNRSGIIACLCFLAIGAYALYYGKSFQDRQLTTIHRLDTAYQNRVQKQIRNFTADTTTQQGKQRYQYAHDAFMNEWFTRPMVWKQPAPLQAMSIGQSDTQPFFYNLWVYMNVYNTKYLELRNPEKLMTGNFDLSFVILYLLPLLIITVSYGVLSEDRESGISPVAYTQGATTASTLYTRLGFRLLVVCTIAVALSFAGFILNGVTELAAISGWTLIVLGYTLFWFAVVAVIVSLQKTSAINALALVSMWVAVLIFIPTVVNSLRDAQDPERLTLSDASREVSSKFWGMEKKRVVDTLYQVRPQWGTYASRDTNEIRSTAYAYLTALHMNGLGRDIDAGIRQEEEYLRHWNIINPAFTAQLALNTLAQSEIDQFIAFRQAASDYQQRRMEALFDVRLSGRPFTVDVYEAYPQFKPTDYETKQSIRSLLLPLFILTVALFVISLIVLRKKEVIVFNT